MPNTCLSNAQKIATVLMAMGAERASHILEQLNPEQTARVVREIAAMGSVSNHIKRSVLREFRALVHAEEQRNVGITFAEEVLDKALGAEEAQNMLSKIKPALTPSGPALLTTLSAEHAVELLQGEPVHVIAMLLLGIPHEHAAAILVAMPPNLQQTVARQLGATHPPTAELRAMLEKALRVKHQRLQQQAQANGRALLAEVAPAPAAPAGASRRVTSASRVPAPAPEDAAPGFFDLARWEHAALQALLLQVDSLMLCQALCGADQPLRAKMLAALPFGRRVAIQNRLRGIGPVSLRAIAEAQEAIAELALRTSHVREALYV